MCRPAGFVRRIPGIFSSFCGTKSWAGLVRPYPSKLQKKDSGLGFRDCIRISKTEGETRGEVELLPGA